MRLSLSLGFGMRPAPVALVPRVCCLFVVGKTIEISSLQVSANGMPTVDL
jgi:hypothetical protein